MKNSEIKKNLEGYLKLFPEEEGNFNILEKQLTNDENLTSRKNFNGHITGGAFLIHPTKGEVFLIFHNKLQKWLQPGGHFEEGDKNSIENALREAREETGFQDLELHPWHEQNNFLPIDIETHFIPENLKKGEPSHYHHDFRYVFIAKNPDERLLQTEEVSDGKWVSYLTDVEGFDGNRALNKIRNMVIRRKISPRAMYLYLALGLVTTLLPPYLCYLWLHPVDIVGWVVYIVVSFLFMVVSHFIGTVVLFMLFRDEFGNKGTIIVK